jgi:uncharacterized protein YndB with AHSA1/START domain
MTTKEATAEVVRKSITVDAPPERAFDVFTSGMTRWWPLDTHHIGASEPNQVVVEPRAGGRWFERAPDGSECEWGRVIAWDPPQHVVFGWHLGPEWKYDPDPALATEVEVRFIAESATRTRVELEHRGFEVHGDRADELRIPVGGKGGWGALLERFAAAAA